MTWSDEEEFVPSASSYMLSYILISLQVELAKEYVIWKRNIQLYTAKSSLQKP